MKHPWMQRLVAIVAITCLWAGSALAAPPPAGFRPEVKFAQVGDIRMAYDTKGQGEPLLMINGFLSTMSLWDPLMLDELAKEHKLILFDNRGAGLSTDTPQNHTTIQQMADDAAGLVRSLGYSKVNVLAYSMGARIGQQLLIRHPDLVAKAVLSAADPGGRSDTIDPPKNSLLIASQIPFSWLAFFEGGHAFLFQSYQQFADTVNVFLRG